MGSLIKILQERDEKMEEVREQLFELETEYIGAEVRHEGRDATIVEVDWKSKAVLLNYDDEKYEWVDFG